MQKVPAYTVVLRSGLNDAEHHLPALNRYADGYDYLVFSEALPVHDHGHEIIPVKPPLHKIPKLPLAGPDEAPRDRGRAEREGAGYGFGAFAIVPATESVEHPPEKPLVHVFGFLKALIGVERNLFVVSGVPDPLIYDWQPLVLHVYIAFLLSPPCMP